jgi:hypothetical protein
MLPNYSNPCNWIHLLQAGARWRAGLAIADNSKPANERYRFPHGLSAAEFDPRQMMPLQQREGPTSHMYAWINQSFRSKVCETVNFQFRSEIGYGVTKC